MKRVAMALVRFYRKYLSGLKPAPTCRFTPTCSAYSLEAFEKRGFFAGLALTLSPCGFDPVPRAGFKTMPMRWSKFDKYQAERRAQGGDLTDAPSDDLSYDPSCDPSDIPSCDPSCDPSDIPSCDPTEGPTEGPTKGPTKDPANGLASGGDDPHVGP